MNTYKIQVTFSDLSVRYMRIENVETIQDALDNALDTLEANEIGMFYEYEITAIKKMEIK